MYLKLNPDSLVNVCKVIIGFAGKNDQVYFRLTSGQLTLFNEFYSFTVNVLKVLEDDDKTYSIYAYDLTSLSKLTKRDRGSEIILKDNYVILESGVQFTLNTSEVSLDKTNCLTSTGSVLFLDNPTLSTLSKTLQKQKGFNYILAYPFCFLVVGSYMVSKVSIYESTEEASYKCLKFKNTQLNNLMRLEEEIGFCIDDLSIWAGDSFTLKMPEVLGGEFNLTHWKTFQNHHNPILKFKFTGIGHIETLIKSSKVSDAFDLCSLNFDGTDTLTISFYQDRESKSKLTLKRPDNSIFPDKAISIYMRTQNLLSLLNLSNNELYLEFTSADLPLYAYTDLGIESFIMLSMTY